MFPNFPEYVMSLKPRLEDAFNRTLSDIVGDGVPDRLGLLRDTLRGGKKIRGCLLCLAAEAAGGTLDAALPRAVAVELIHTASLIHDDFVDQDATRRNLPAAWTLTGARRAVLLGDLIFASAIDLMTDLGREDGRIASRAIARLARGAFHEPLDAAALAEEMASGRFDPDIYEKIIALKTGILFGAACQAGALSAGMSLPESGHWLEYGQRIGEAYQMADDLHDIRRFGAAGSIHPGALAELAPALSYFVKESEASIQRALLSGNPIMGDESLAHFRAAEIRMAEEIERRLASDIPLPDVPVRAFLDLLRRAPRDLIGLFDAGELTARRDPGR